MSDLLRWPDKHPDEKLILGADWTLHLSGATIASVAADVVSGDVTVNVPQPSTFSGAIQSLWVSGGTAGVQKVRCTVTMSDGRVLQQDFGFNVI